MSAEQTGQKPGFSNDSLSHDILWMIFDFYAETDGPKDPLEKLLHVCKYWSLAAHRHRRLWTKFSIKLVSNDDLKFWLSRTLSRLKICGEEGPAEVDFTYDPHSDSGKFDKDMALTLSYQLVGHEGSLVDQWTKISVELVPSPVRETWMRALSRPTPNLRFLKIAHVVATKPILPFAPSLEELILSNCDCALGNDFGQLKILGIRGYGSNIQNISSVLTAANLNTLSFTNWGRNVTLPPSFATLESASFTAGAHIWLIEKFSAPRLRSLTIFLRTEECITALKNCRGIDFQRLETLAFGCWIYSQSETPAIMQSMKDIFRAVKGVQQLCARNLKALRTLLLCIGDKLNPTIERRGCSIRLLYYLQPGDRLIDETFSISADTTEEDIRRVRLWANLPVDDSWDELISSFKF
ncbi:hypothetical protein CPB86DRAFT_117856 [Serendipita vermifera]|nr:hypothetical protein CPB86DRAFT_117856 [Serendipita vermifera]